MRSSSIYNIEMEILFYELLIQAGVDDDCFFDVLVNVNILSFAVDELKRFEIDAKNNVCSFTRKIFFMQVTICGFRRQRIRTFEMNRLFGIETMYGH